MGTGKKMGLPFFPLYPVDFLGSTGKLNAEKFGVYVRLLFTSWDEPLEDDIEELMEIARADEKTVRYILDRYFRLIDGVWHNGRLERERVKAEEKHKRRVEAGKKGAMVKHSSSNASSKQGSKTVATQNSELRTQKTEQTTDSVIYRSDDPSQPVFDLIFDIRGSHPTKLERVEFPSLIEKHGIDKVTDAIKECGNSGWRATVKQVIEKIEGNSPLAGFEWDPENE